MTFIKTQNRKALKGFIILTGFIIQRPKFPRGGGPQPPRAPRGSTALSAPPPPPQLYAYVLNINPALFGGRWCRPLGLLHYKVKYKLLWSKFDRTKDGRTNGVSELSRS